MKNAVTHGRKPKDNPKGAENGPSFHCSLSLWVPGTAEHNQPYYWIPPDNQQDKKHQQQKQVICLANSKKDIHRFILELCYTVLLGCSNPSMTLSFRASRTFEPMMCLSLPVHPARCNCSAAPLQSILKHNASSLSWDIW